MENKKVFVIVGNGFDLAHNDVTKFSDFAKWLIILFAKEIKKGSEKSTDFSIGYINKVINTRIDTLKLERETPGAIISNNEFDQNHE